MFALLALAGCETLPRSADEPLPVGTDNTAVVALLEGARQNTSSGRLQAAAANLERALRIEPRNPVLWHELARVRLGQSEAGQAEQLAAKSNTFAANNNALRAANWRVIAQARGQSGNQAGAEAAFSKAEELERQR
jgi:cytochrome c-type biogenesis protein CcmH/NrfG